MKNFQKGFAWTPVLLVILGLIVVGGGAYYVGHENAAPAQPNYQDISTEQQQTNTQANTVANTPTKTTQTQNASTNTSASTATINKASLTTNSNIVTIAGTCANVTGAVAIYVLKGSATLPSTALPSSGVVYSDSTVAGQTFDANCSSSNGTFSTHNKLDLGGGIYTVGIYNIYKYATDNTQADIRLLASGTLNSSYATADVLPTSVGQCVVTTVKEVDSNTSAGEVAAGRSAVQYNARGAAGYGYQVSDTRIAGIDNSRAGDSVKLCLKSLPPQAECPAGQSSALRTYTATNLRTNETWEAADGRFVCN